MLHDTSNAKFCTMPRMKRGLTSPKTMNYHFSYSNCISIVFLLHQLSLVRALFTSSKTVGCNFLHIDLDKSIIRYLLNEFFYNFRSFRSPFSVLSSKVSYTFFQSLNKFFIYFISHFRLQSSLIEFLSYSKLFEIVL